MADLSRDPSFFAVLTGSYARRLGETLVPAGADAAWLYEAAPFAVLAHDGATDPRFVYANRAAQACFGYARAELVGLPSRLSAEAPERAERQRLLDAVAQNRFHPRLPRPADRQGRPAVLDRARGGLAARPRRREPGPGGDVLGVAGRVREGEADGPVTISRQGGAA